jgi:DNA-directed RNA polymerase subunit RPC12/RpoP
VYKGDDAQERMRSLLQAYKVLNDPAARKEYDADTNRRPVTATKTSHSARKVTTPSARRDRQRHYAFPTIRQGNNVTIDLVDFTYTLSPRDAQTLVLQGLLRGAAPEGKDHAYFCHRCHHRWSEAGNDQEHRKMPIACPHCYAQDWSEFLLLRCIHCSAVFESEQIRYEIGSVTYGNARAEASLCPPYELFPLCPYCGTARWCPAEDTRVQDLRERAARRETLVRSGLIVVAIVALVFFGIVFLGVLH